MWIPLLIMVLGFYCFFAVIMMQRARIEVLQREKKASWVQEIINQN